MHAWQGSGVRHAFLALPSLQAALSVVVFNVIEKNLLLEKRAMFNTTNVL